MTKILLIAIAWLGSLLCAFWLGGASDDSNDFISYRVADDNSASAKVSQAPATDTIRQIIQEEFHRRAQRSAAKSECTVTKASTMDVNDDTKSHAKANARMQVDIGISDGVWSEEDVRSLRGSLNLLNSEESEKILAPLFAAINDQRLVLEAPPF